MAAETSRGCIVQFAKAPVPGQVKTRLFDRYTGEQAAAIARALTLQVAQALQAVPAGWVRVLCADDPQDPFLRALATHHGRPLLAQGDGDLGERMHRICSAVLTSAVGAGPARDCRGQGPLLPPDAVIVVGSDCLGYDPGYLRAAVAALAGGADAVLGPSTDGGYVLIGLRRCPPDLFSGIAWSSAAVAEQQRVRLRAGGLHWEELPLRSDIDRPEDLPPDFDWRGR